VYGRNLVVLRALKGLSQAELAHKAELDQSYISRLEAGHTSNPTFDTLRKLATALDMSLAELVTALNDGPFVSAAAAA
jgi:transcriptional regulator with XRE-family HTH domain